jgi:hypothetical protein
MVLLACLGLAGMGDAQVPQAVQIQGTIQSADCQTGLVTFATTAGNDTFQANDQTVAYVNGTTVPLCSLQSYAGDSATALLTPAGNALALNQINVSAAQAAPSTSGSILSSPIAIGIGALLLGGIIGYVVGHQNAPAQTPAYTPYGYNTPVYYPSGYSTPVYYPAGYAPSYLPAQYPYNRPYYHQGHRYYRCTNGAWSVDRTCQWGGAQNR